MALGQSNVAAGAAGEHAYDQRLFDQEAGIGSGFHGDDAYDVYDKPLFNDKGGASTSQPPTPTKIADGAARAAPGAPPDRWSSRGTAVVVAAVVVVVVVAAKTRSASTRS